MSIALDRLDELLWASFGGEVVLQIVADLSLAL